jgi:hypothetical protein
MKITKSQLKQIIKEELGSLSEGREEHRQGVSDKIDRLRDEVERARNVLEEMEAAATDPYSEEMTSMNLMDIRSRNEYFEIQTRIYNMEDKITLLVKQLQQLEQETPGQLERP